MPRRIIVGVAAGLVLLGGGAIRAQETFEVASVRRSGAVDNVVPGVFLPNGQWSARGATLAMLLRSAYGLERFAGMPAWAYTARFDIVTTPSRDVPLAQLQAMARTLLADRFELRARLEPQIAEVYALARAKEPGPLGPGLRPSADACPRGPQSADVPVEIDRVTRCAESVQPLEGGLRRVRLRDRPLGDFLVLLGAGVELGEPIADRTGLTGRFDIDLEYVPRSSRGQNADGLGLPFEAAVERQLGLRFERRREPLDVLVIEHVALPSGN